MRDPEMSGHEDGEPAAPCPSQDTPVECALSREVPSALAALEEQLSQEVPLLLESMNRTSAEVNMFEARAGEAQRRYQDLLADWSQMYESLHAQFGSAIDRVKPYFDAAQVFAAASQRVQGAVREFSTASSQHARAKERLNELERIMEPGSHNVLLDGEMQDGLSRATVEVTRCQRERDRLEGEYAKALKEYQKSQRDLEAWRAHIGDATIKRTLPCFRQLHQQQLKLASEQNRISAFADRARAAKSAYGTSMRELDRISTAIHAARRDHAEGRLAPAPAAARQRGAGGSRPTVAAQPEDSPEATLELAPEVARVFGEECSSCSAEKARTPPRRLSVAALAPEDDGPFA
ncbi:unnamed protein product [Prorocentrum cordatum]|uniref:Uncharacterized protein n=1 Tax=Prorocentrum cordatum TaxID=2364126 RepID=A0ABN9PGL2_9DINO|nr:unnamed protein product [Polarella glacialis]